MAQVLLVVDGDAPAEPLRAALESAAGPRGAEVVVARSGEEAVSLAGAHDFELAAADLLLPRPGLSGTVALRRITEHRPGCRTLLYTRHGYLRDLLAHAADAVVFLDGGEAGGPAGSAHDLVSRAAELLRERPPTAEAARPERHPSLPAEGSSRPGPGSVVAGKYHLVERIGRGGTGVVFRAEDTFIQRPVAVKLVRLEQATTDVEAVSRSLLREVRIAGRLAHPNLVTLYDAGLEGGEIYVVMEWVEGQNLRDHLGEHGPRDAADAVEIVRQVLAGLEHAHAQGVVHRDLKPSNVLLSKQGVAKVTDFGVAKLFSLAAPAPGTSSDSLPEEMLGTLVYMAPEQMVGEPIDRRTDLYAVGAVLFELLHGRPLASLSGPYARAAAHHAGRRPPPLPPVPGEPRLSAVVERALDVDPERRYPSAREMSKALEDALDPGWLGRLRRLWPSGGGR